MININNIGTEKIRPHLQPNLYNGITDEVQAEFQVWKIPRNKKRRSNGCGHLAGLKI